MYFPVQLFTAWSMAPAGAKDMLVLPELNALIGVWPDELTVEADVRDMPGIWVSADHQVLLTPDIPILLLYSYHLTYHMHRICGYSCCASFEQDHALLCAA